MTPWQARNIVALALAMWVVIVLVLLAIAAVGDRHPMTARIMVTITVQREGGEWDDQRTLTIGGATLADVREEWRAMFPSALDRAIARAPEGEDEEEEAELVRVMAASGPPAAAPPKQATSDL